MNDFDEDKWTEAQRELDGQIAAEFDGLEGSYAANEGPLGAWLEATAEHVTRIRALVGKLEHAGRREYWDRNMQRLGVAPVPAPRPDPKPAFRGGKAPHG